MVALKKAIDKTHRSCNAHGRGLIPEAIRRLARDMIGILPLLDFKKTTQNPTRSTSRSSESYER